MKPDFLWVGLNKAGSSLTYHVLSRHPGIFLGARKEHGFFSDADRFAQGEAYYDMHLAGKTPDQISGDITPGYFAKDERLNRIVEFYGRDSLPRIIFCLRNPISYAVSRYHHTLKVGNFLDRQRRMPRDVNTFARALFSTPDMLGERVRAVAHRLGGRRNICLLIYEEDFSGAYGFEQRIYDFLGLPSEQRCYDPKTDHAVYSGVAPHFVLPSPQERHISTDGKTYHIPANTGVFCSLDRHSRTFETPQESFVANMARANSDWSKPMDPALMDELYETQTRPLKAYLGDAFGREITNWGARIPQRQYPKASLPRALRVRRNETTT